MGLRVPDRETQLLARLQELRDNEEADRANLEQAILEQQGLNASDRSGTPIITSGLQNFVDASTGSNFSRSAEALVNQRNLIASGQDGLTKTLNDEFAERQRVAQQQDLEQELKLLDQERKEADLKRKLIDQDGKERERQARIGKLQAETANVGKGGVSSKNSVREAAEGRRQATGRKKLLDDSFVKPIRKKIDTDTFKFQTTTATWRDALKTGDLASINSAVSGFAKGFQGESGVLTDTDIGRQFIKTIPDRISSMKEILLGPKRNGRAKLNSEERLRLASVVNAAITARREASVAFIRDRASDTTTLAEIGTSGDRELLATGDDGLSIIERKAKEKIDNIIASLPDIDVSQFENFEFGGQQAPAQSPTNPNETRQSKIEKLKALRSAQP